MMSERNNEDQEETLPLAVDLESASYIADELLRQHPPYEGPDDCESTVEQNAAYIIRRLARRLRETTERPRPLPWWCGLEIKTSDFLPRGYIWLHSATEAGDPAKDDLNAIIKGVS